jgi:hypothetical protein
MSGTEKWSLQDAKAVMQAAAEAEQQQDLTFDLTDLQDEDEDEDGRDEDEDEEEDSHTLEHVPAWQKQQQHFDYLSPKAITQLNREQGLTKGHTKGAPASFGGESFDDDGDFSSDGGSFSGSGSLDRWR